MAVTLGNNISSLKAQRALADSTSALGRVFERLSSGLRINHAADDAAGLAVSSSLNAGSRIYTQGVRNINDGISALTIAEGGLSQASGLAGRLKELAEQAANGTFSLTQRRSINSEADALTKEFNRLIDTTQFNSRDLLKANLGELRIQFGFGTNGSIGVTVGDQLARNVGNGSFASTVSSIANYTSDLVDFNGDGKADLVTTNNGAVNVALGNGDGTFAAGVDYTRPAGGGGGINGGAGDFNGDGKQDLLVGNPNTGAYNLYFGNGNGTFQAAVSGTGLATGGNYYSQSLSDINGDGRTDLISINPFASGVINVSLANSDGTFQSLQSYNMGVTTNSLVGLTLADFDGDGKTDVMVSTGANAQVQLLKGNGAGSFTSSTTIASTPAGAYTTGITSGDFDGDGTPDFAFISRDENKIYVYKNTGSGNFSLAQTRDTGHTSQYPTLLKSADVNGDGILDLVSGDSGFSPETGISIYLGSGDSTFNARSHVGSATVTSVAFGDLNGDGVNDLVIGDYGGNSVSAMIQGATRSTYLQKFSLNTRADALSAFDVIDAFQRRISAELGAIGAFQSRLSTAASVTGGTALQYSTASGRIMDADTAAESASLVRYQILREAGASVLAQANQQPALALQLIR